VPLASGPPKNVIANIRLSRLVANFFTPLPKLAAGSALADRCPAPGKSSRDRVDAIAADPHAIGCAGDHVIPAYRRAEPGPPGGPERRHLRGGDDAARTNRHLTWIHIAFLAVVSLMPFSTGLVSAYVTYRIPFILYWLNLLFLGLVLLVSLWYARRAGLLKA